MKNTILTLSIAVCLVGTVLSGCQTSAKKIENAENKVQDARENLADAKQDLSNAQNDSAREYLEFKRESEEKIRANDSIIAEFNARISNEKMDNKAQYEQKLAELQQTNSDLKKKLDEYSEQGKDAWIKFEIGFNHDMDALKHAIKNLTNRHV